MLHIKNKWIIGLLSLCLWALTPVAIAAGPANYLFEMPKIDPKDQNSLQRGAKYYMNYCSGCHSLQFMRYERMARDIGMTDDKGEVLSDIVKANLMFTSDRIGDQILVALQPEESRHWFGVTPPDLSLISRYRSNKWVYNYLLSFYVDEKRPWGANNVLFPDVSMPDVLVNLQGEQKPIFHTTESEALGQKVLHKTIVGLESVKPGELSPEEFKSVVYDIVNFLSYVGDPVKVQREQMGFAVILFLLVLLVFAYLLKREYWKDVN